MKRGSASTGGRGKKTESAATQQSLALDLFGPEPEAAPSGTSPKAVAAQAPLTPATAKKTAVAKPAVAKPGVAKVAAPKAAKVAAPKAAKGAKAAPVAPASLPAQLLDAPTAPQTSAAPATKVKKPRRARVPDDLSIQYGENASRRLAQGIEEPQEEAGPRKRMTRQEREARRQVMAPDSGLLDRLSKINTLPLKPRETVPKVKGKTWEFVCGKCGTRTRFEPAPAALCPTCGAITLKD